MLKELIYIKDNLDARIKGNTRHVLEALLDYSMHREGDIITKVYPSNITIAKKKGIDLRTVTRQKNKLENLKLIERYYDPVIKKDCMKLYLEEIVKYLKPAAQKYIPKILLVIIPIPVNVIETNCPSLVGEIRTNCLSSNLNTELSNSTSTVVDKALEAEEEITTKEMAILTNNLASHDLIQKHRHTFKAPCSTIVKAINIVNSLKVADKKYASFLDKAMFQLNKEKRNEDAVRANLLELKGASFAGKPKRYSPDQVQAAYMDPCLLVDIARNYNRNWGSYGLPAAYAYAAENLKMAGVSFHMG